ncbi:MAG: DUF116 domain-containing protein, partial [Pseudomonadota bacterium]
DAGTMRVHLWTGPGGKRIRQALIAGDFFTVPMRLINDLEASLKGRRLDRGDLEDSVRSFFGEYDGGILGITPEKTAQAIGDACDRLKLVNGHFTLSDSNDLFLLNVKPQDLRRLVPGVFLLPYCSKAVACPYRGVPGCDECGSCDVGECMALAGSFGMVPVTVQSFEHLMEVLHGRCEDRNELYVGSCCEAFYAKHQQEMESVRAAGVLINLDSTTCYDLGKGSEAYKGNFDNQTFLNLPLIEKTLRYLNDSKK